MDTRSDEDRLRGVLLGQTRLIEEVYSILDEEQKKDDILKAFVLGAQSDGVNRIAGLDNDRVFSLVEIQRICVRFRLRFLPASLFKGTLPSRAVLALRRLEARSETPLVGFHIMAPASRFKLGDSDADPLLFVPVGQDRFYLVYKWGADMAWHRALCNLPFRSPMHLFGSVSVLALIIACSVPTALISALPDAPFLGGHRAITLFWCSMVAYAITAFAWFTFFGQFSKEAWRSKCFN